MIKPFLKRLVLSLILGLFLVYLFNLSYFKLLFSVLFSSLGFLYNYLNENNYIYLNEDNNNINYDYNLYIESSNNSPNSNTTTSNNNSSANVSNSTSNSTNPSNDELTPSITIPLNKESANIISSFLPSSTAVGFAAGVKAGLELSKGQNPAVRTVTTAGAGIAGGIAVGFINAVNNIFNPSPTQELVKKASNILNEEIINNSNTSTSLNNNETRESSFFNLEEWINWLTIQLSGSDEEVIIKSMLVFNLCAIVLLLVAIYLLLFRFFVGERFLNWVFSKLSFIKSSRFEQIKNWIFFYKRVQIKLVDYNVFIIILGVILLLSLNIYGLYVLLYYSSLFK